MISGRLACRSCWRGRLGACLIAQTYSRLVIDCNRAPGHPQSVAQVSDGVTIPGNADLGAEETAARVARNPRALS